MKIFDFNLHLSKILSENVNDAISSDMSLKADNLLKSFDNNKIRYGTLDGGNFLLLNGSLLDDNGVDDFFQSVRKSLEYTSFTLLIDFHRTYIQSYLEVAKALGVKAIFFNSYLQEISEADFGIILNICKFAEKNNLMICIDGSYGTSKMYTYDNLKLACFIADSITNVPIVIIHSGGYRIIEAMLLAAEKNNVFLDTSFSLPYYMGSSIEMDYQYAIRKIGVNRFIYGSDDPYIELENALQMHLGFFKKYNFSDNEIEKILFGNAVDLFR